MKPKHLLVWIWLAFWVVFFAMDLGNFRLASF
jgi:hypothetical protein